ncbi:MAG: hypothetical protein F9K48_09840 [Candidatus Brocadia sp.]|nr:MAG: hypothetical protein F9K48_09840 [Candidatus Brocadia sp.]
MRNTSTSRCIHIFFVLIDDPDLVVVFVHVLGDEAGNPHTLLVVNNGFRPGLGSCFSDGGAWTALMRYGHRTIKNKVKSLPNLQLTSQNYKS